MYDMDQPSFSVISDYERHNHLKPKVMQFTDEADSNNNEDESEVNGNSGENGNSTTDGEAGD